MIRIIAALVMALAGACNSTATHNSPTTATTVVDKPMAATVTAPSEIDARFVPAMLAAAQSYLLWGRVDEQLREAPAPCAAAPSPREVASHPRLSAASTGPHGRKLYYLWASDRTIYTSRAPVPTGFAIVKESFVAEPGPPLAAALSGNPMQTLTTASGEQLSVGARKDLFIMAKVAQTDGTDDGWIYGTVAVDGTVTSAGRVASCMGCHDKDAHYERLFGLATSH